MKTNTQAGNLFESVEGNSKQEFFDNIINNEHVTIQRIVSRGHTSPQTGWYDQAQDEWIAVIKGSAIISFQNDEKIKLECGNHMTIPAHRKHKVSWTEPQTETIWLAVHYSA